MKRNSSGSRLMCLSKVLLRFFFAFVFGFFCENKKARDHF